MEDPVHRVEISGAALALLLRDFGSSRGDCDGLLFGRLHRRTTPNLQDDDYGPTEREEVTAIVTGCCCTGTLMSFYDPAGHVDRRKLARIVGQREKWGGDPLIGWLVGRRNTPMRPSMREAAVTADLATAEDAADSATTAASSASTQGIQHRVRGDGSAREDDGIQGANATKVRPSLGLPYSASESSSSCSRSSVLGGDGHSGPARQVTTTAAATSAATGAQHPQVPCLFLLLTEYSAENTIHTHEYRAFQYHRGKLGGVFEPRPVVVRNLGQSANEQLFHGLYGGFAPVAPLPWLNYAAGNAAGEEADSWRRSERDTEKASDVRGGQALLNMYAEGYSMEQMQGLARWGGVQEIETLYGRMLFKLEKIAREVRRTSADVLKQEKLNASLKAQLAGDHF